MKKGKFGLGLLFGAIAGVATGLLAAPKSGKETRGDLKRRALDAKDDVEQVAEKKIEQAKDMAKERLNMARSQTEDAEKRATRTAETTRQATKEAAEKVKKAAESK